jgi:taurine dioxygenase
MTLTVVPTGETLGATVKDIDLSAPLAQEDFGEILLALGHFGVLRFPDQNLDARALKQFSERFGGLQVSLSGMYTDPEVREVMILSNIVEDGKPIGLADAGQDWHTDMSYNAVIGFVNVLHGVKVPRRNGEPLGATEFANMRAAYEDLPSDLKERLAGMTVTHDFNKFWENMRSREGSRRPPLTEEQRRRRPPAVHPIFLTHPITGEKVLYANPGYAERINELDEEESRETLAFLFEHQLKPKYRYTHRWTEGDVLVWDHIGTLHNAVADYGPDEHRLMKRCQVYADRIFDPAFVKAALSASAAHP